MGRIEMDRRWWRLAPRQLYALLAKNLIVRARSWKTNLLSVMQAVAFVLLVWVIDKAITFSNSQYSSFSADRSPDPVAVTDIPPCTSNKFIKANRHCYTFLYTPNNNTRVDELVNIIRTENNPVIPEDRVLGLRNQTEVDDFLVANPEIVMVVLHVISIDNKTLDYMIQLNGTVRFFKGRWEDPNLYLQLPMQRAVERAFAIMVTKNPNLEWSVNYRDFPHPVLTQESTVGRVAPVFILASLTFNFVMLLTNVVKEKESGVRQAMVTMGLLDSPYWASWCLSEAAFGFLHALVMSLTALALRFELVVKNDFMLMFVLILLTDWALCAFALLISVFTKRSTMAVPISFGVYIIAWIFQLVIIFGFPFKPSYRQIYQVLFALFPWSMLSKGLQDMATAAQGSSAGIVWAERFSYCSAKAPPPDVEQRLRYFEADCTLSIGTAFQILVLQSVAYVLLAVYLDNVMGQGKRSWWYFLQPGYWFPSKKPYYGAAAAALKQAEVMQPGEYDSDVYDAAVHAQEVCRRYLANETVPVAKGHKETKSVQSNPLTEEQSGGVDKKLRSSASDASSLSSKDQGVKEEDRVDRGVHMFGLRKVFVKSTGWWSWMTCGWCGPRSEFIAVRSNWLSLPSGQCFCLLGPNGAGKTTTIQCLTGIITPTAGDALMFGHSIRSAGGLDAIRPLLGVCPQFDVLWSNLTGAEHLKLFADIKGLPWGLRNSEVARLLERVKLSDAAKLRSKAYSGGMKRRLSLAMAMLGDPAVLVLDEPTTGMDPISRRHVWDLINEAKRDRVVLLTTHSMEEADILGDRVGIFVRGMLRCVGTSLHLKAKFGSGYRLSIGLKQGDQLDPVTFSLQRTNLKTAMAAQMPSAVLFDESQAYLHWLVPHNMEGKLADTLLWLDEKRDELNIGDVQLALTPLEEVFLNVAGGQAPTAAVHGSGPSVHTFGDTTGEVQAVTILEENITLEVPVGVDSINTPAGNTYRLRWSYSPDGDLFLQDYTRTLTRAESVGPAFQHSSLLRTTTY